MSLRKQRVPLAYRIVGRHLHRFVYRLVTGPLDANRMSSHRHGVFHDRRLPDVGAIDEHFAVRVSGNGDQAFSRGLRRLRGRHQALSKTTADRTETCARAQGALLQNPDNLKLENKNWKVSGHLMGMGRRLTWLTKRAG